MTLNRSAFVSTSAAASAALVMGFRPDRALAVEAGALRLAKSDDLGSLDPGYFTSLPAETGTLYC